MTKAYLVFTGAKMTAKDEQAFERVLTKTPGVVWLKAGLLQGTAEVASKSELDGLRKLADLIAAPK